jgi:hypothetical protein
MICSATTAPPCYACGEHVLVSLNYAGLRRGNSILSGMHAGALARYEQFLVLVGWLV